jgi:hypothetical protein
MNNLQAMLGMGGGGGQQGGDSPMVDTSEQILISSLSLLKMLIHGKIKNKYKKITTPLCIFERKKNFDEGKLINNKKEFFESSNNYMK